MKAFCLVTAGVLALMLVALPEPARTAQTGATASQPSESSAARKKVRHKTHATVRRKGYVTDSRSPYYLRPGVRPSFGYIGPPGYAGEYAWRKSIGQCVEDLGYGRWSPCGSR